MDKIVVKSIAFNLADPDQRKMYEYASQRTNFSAYGKRLIQRDMEGWVQESKPIDREYLKQLI